MVQSKTYSLLRDGADFTDDQNLESLATVTFDDLLQFEAKWLKRIRIVAYMMGNLNQQIANEILASIETSFNAAALRKDEVPPIRAVKLEEGTVVNYNFELYEEEKNSSVKLHYQQGVSNLRD